MNYILVIDDDEKLCKLIKRCIVREDAAVHTYQSGIDGLFFFKSEPKNCILVILDIMMPQLDGYQILEEIRKISSVPILMLTAKDSEADKVRGLQLGADDYLTKPFGILELKARVDSLIRRYTKFSALTVDEPTPLILKTMTIDSARCTVWVRKRNVDLTGKEVNLLLFLATHPGQIFTKKQIYTQVWGDKYLYDDGNVMSFISKLRKKIEPDSEHPFYILTVYGVGYRFNQEA